MMSALHTCALRVSVSTKGCVKGQQWLSFLSKADGRDSSSTLGGAGCSV